MVNFISRGNGNWNKECFIDKDIINLDIQLKIAFWDKEGEISSPWWENSQDDNQTVVVHYKLVKLKKKNPTCWAVDCYRFPANIEILIMKITRWVNFSENYNFTSRIDWRCTTDYKGVLRQVRKTLYI